MGDAKVCGPASEDRGNKDVCPLVEPEMRPLASLCKFPNHKSGTRAVKEAL